VVILLFFLTCDEDEVITLVWFIFDHSIIVMYCSHFILLPLLLLSCWLMFVVRENIPDIDDDLQTHSDEEVILNENGKAHFCIATNGYQLLLLLLLLVMLMSMLVL